MNEQFLQDLRQYLQKHIEDEAEIVQKNESCSYKMMEDVFLPQFTKIKPLIEDREDKTQQQFKMYEQSAVPPTKEIANRDKLKKASFTVSPETDIEEYIRKTKSEETFSTKLLKYIDQTGLSDPEVYKRAGIDRKHFSKIRCDRNYRPRKTTAIALCLALELKLDQVEEVLELAGHSLSNSDTADLIVKFCIEKGKYDLMDVNEALVYFGMKAIGV